AGELPGAGEEDQRHRELRDGEDGAEAAAIAARQGGTGRAQRRRGADEERAGDGGGGGEGELAPADGDGGGARDPVGRGGAQPREEPGRRECAEGAGEAGDERALEEEEPGKLSARRAERGADGELDAAADRARQRQPGEVGAGDGEDRQDRGGEERQRRP